jgi:hypothetical protein
MFFAFTVSTFPFFPSFFFLTKFGSRLGSEDFITKHDGVTHDNAPTGPTQDGTITCTAQIKREMVLGHTDSSQLGMHRNLEHPTAQKSPQIKKALPT